MKAKLKCLFITEKTRLNQSRSHVFSFKTLRYIETSHLTYLHTYIYIHINIDLCQKTWDRHWRLASLVLCLCELVWRYRTASSVYRWAAAGASCGSGIQNSLEKGRDESSVSLEGAVARGVCGNWRRSGTPTAKRELVLRRGWAFRQFSPGRRK